MRAPAFLRSLGLATLLAACGSAPPATAIPSPAPVITAAFRTHAPVGWTDSTHDASARAALSGSTGLDLLLTHAPAPPLQAGVSDLRATIVVTTIPDSPIPSDAIADYLSNVTAAGATHISVPAALSVGNVAGTEVTYDHTVAGTPARSRDIVVSRPDASYEITVDASQSGFSQADAALTDVLAAWAWIPAVTPSAVAQTH